MAAGDQLRHIEPKHRFIESSDGRITGAHIHTKRGDVHNWMTVTEDSAGAATLQAPSGAVVALSELIPEVLANPTATTTVLTGAGAYAGYRCTTAAGNITVYDNTAASGKVLVPTQALTVGAFPIYGAGHNGRVPVATGVTVVLSGAAVVYAGVE